MADSHGAGEDGARVTVVGTVLECRPVNTGFPRVVTGRRRVFVVKNDYGLFMLKRLGGVCAAAATAATAACCCERLRWA